MVHSGQEAVIPTEQADEPADPVISEARNPRGYSDISTVYAYYTPEEKVLHGKHCEVVTNFGHRPGTSPYTTGDERSFIAKFDAENPGKFTRYLISWSGCD